MKPPYIDITAECSRHGQFRELRKPNKRTENIQKGQEGFYSAVKCPKCPWWATIITQNRITADLAKPADQAHQGELL
jgi:ssDNA-binding Zn-finger/Zn-ribbon topoisomerase 1